MERKKKGHRVTFFSVWFSLNASRELAPSSTSSSIPSLPPFFPPPPPSPQNKPALQFSCAFTVRAESSQTRDEPSIKFSSKFLSRPTWPFFYSRSSFLLTKKILFFSFYTTIDAEKLNFYRFWELLLEGLRQIPRLGVNRCETYFQDSTVLVFHFSQLN